MTYARLAEVIAQMTPEQRECDATVYCMSSTEFLPVLDLYEVDDEDENEPGAGILDNAHPYLAIDF